jgi:hypothetical protein
VGKSNFWDYDQQLFGVDLPPNEGLAGKGMSGEMDKHGDHFSAEGIPLTEFRDSDWAKPDPKPYPYQLAEVIVYDTATSKELARSTVVAPVSTEMNCDDCHFDGGVEDISTGRVETNILKLHDEENEEDYPAGYGPLMDNRPVLYRLSKEHGGLYCAGCHDSPHAIAPGREVNDGIKFKDL